MTVYLTLCFYEYPAAKVHIDFWEKAMGDRIINKQVLEKGIHSKAQGEMTFLVKRGDDFEILRCVPLSHALEIATGSLLEIQYLYPFLDDSSINTTEKIKYLKTLIFGKVEPIEMKFVLLSMGNYSECFA